MRHVLADHFAEHLPVENDSRRGYWKRASTRLVSAKSRRRSGQGKLACLHRYSGGMFKESQRGCALRLAYYDHGAIPRD